MMSCPRVRNLKRYRANLGTEISRWIRRNRRGGSQQLSLSDTPLLSQNCAETAPEWIDGPRSSHDTQRTILDEKEARSSLEETHPALESHNTTDEACSVQEHGHTEKPIYKPRTSATFDEHCERVKMTLQKWRPGVHLSRPSTPRKTKNSDQNNRQYGLLPKTNSGSIGDMRKILGRSSISSDEIGSPILSFRLTTGLPRTLSNIMFRWHHDSPAPVEHPIVMLRLIRPPKDLREVRFCAASLWGNVGFVEILMGRDKTAQLTGDGHEQLLAEYCRFCTKRGHAPVFLVQVLLPKRMWKIGRTSLDQ